MQTTGGGAAMAGMFSPEMMKMAQEQMANMTPEQMQAMQRQVRVHALAASGPCARTRRGASAPVPPARGGRAPSRRAPDDARSVHIHIAHEKQAKPGTKTILGPGRAECLHAFRI